MNILVDGYNLYSLHGTGIFRYSCELCRIIHLLGHNASLLFGIPHIHTAFLAKEMILQKIFIQDQKSSFQYGKKKEGIYKKILSSLKTVSLRGRNVYFTLTEEDKKIYDARIKFVSSIYNSCNIHTKSDIAFRFLNKFATINLSSKIDIYHKPYPVPCHIKKCKNIATIHDIIPLKRPHYVTTNVKKFYELIKMTIEKSDRIITISEASKQDILEYFPKSDERKINVVYQSSFIDDSIAKVPEDKVKKLVESIYGLSYKKYIIFYGAIEPKKNVARLISAAMKAKCEFPLVIVGKNGWLFEDVEQLLADIWRTPEGRARIMRFPYLPFEQLAMLISGAAACLFPSLYEGFGLPVIESMQLGCPVITSNVSSLPEVGGDSAHYVDPYSIGDIAAGIDAVCENEEYRCFLEKKGRIHSEKFSPKNYAATLNRIYTNL